LKGFEPLVQEDPNKKEDIDYMIKAVTKEMMEWPLRENSDLLSEIS